MSHNFLAVSHDGQPGYLNYAIGAVGLPLVTATRGI
jgi:hypothetical protein